MQSCVYISKKKKVVKVEILFFPVSFDIDFVWRMMRGEKGRKPNAGLMSGILNRTQCAINRKMQRK